MSQAAVIDGQQFARDGGTTAGNLALAQLPRLAGEGCENARVEYRVAGGRNGEGRLSLRVEADAELTMVCQRCLGQLVLPLQLDNELELTDSEAAIHTANDEVDRVLASSAMEVAALVEDELLLALPMAPMHEGCRASEAGQSAPASPFAALAALKRRE